MTMLGKVQRNYARKSGKMKELNDDFLTQAVRDELDGVVDLRRRLHQIPELGYEEHATAALIRSFLEDVPGLELQTGVAGTGMVALLGGDKSGPCVAFRADMDALPISEASGLAYASTHPGRMHACGHDGHSALMAGLIRVLARCRDRLSGPVKFLFQPAEEGGAGGLKMLEAGVLREPPVEAIFGLHGWPTLEVGQAGAVEGAAFASTHSFDICIQGRAGHAAFPHRTVDPVPVAALLITALQTLVSRETDPLDSAVLSICQIHAGSAYNIIPEEVVLRGTLRCLDPSHRDQLLQRMQAMASGIASAHGARAVVMQAESGYPVLRNHVAATRLVAAVASEVVGSDAWVPVPPTMGGEDFAFFAEQIPACFWLLGVREPGASSWPQLHTSTYDFNDRAMETGLRIQAGVALRFQSGGLAAVTA